VAFSAFLLCRCALALNPSLDISQYAHTAWNIRDGAFRGIIFAIAQTPDGYLWLGTEFGLIRFDGVRFTPWQPPTGQQLPSSVVRSLAVSRDGRLWIGTDRGLASWKNGELSNHPEVAGLWVGPMLVDREGTVWAGAMDGTNRGRLCSIRSDRLRCDPEGNNLGLGVISLYEDTRSSLWAAGVDGLWQWRPAPPKFHRMQDSVTGLMESGDGALLIATSRGISQLVGGKLEPYQLPGVRRPFALRGLFRDRNGGLWIGTHDRGLLHLHGGKMDAFSRSDGLSGNLIMAFFEDREGNIWVATHDGLDRFRDFAVTTITLKQGLSADTVWSVLAARDGAVWLGTSNGLDQWKDRQVSYYGKPNGSPNNSVGSIFEGQDGRIWASTYHGIVCLENGRLLSVSTELAGHIAWSLAGDGTGSLWISQNDSLICLRGTSVLQRIPWAKLGHKDWALSLTPDSARIGLWLGFKDGGVVHFQDGNVDASYTGAEGLGAGFVEALRMDRNGAIWAATQGGLSRIIDGRVSTLSSKNGLPCDTVHWSIEDDDHSLWLYTACGLMRVARGELDAWVADQRSKIQVTVLGEQDGVRSRAVTNWYSPLAAKAPDGRIWFVSLDGVSIIDPRHLPANNIPPPVHIERILIDDKESPLKPGMRLQANIRNLRIDYTALSLVAPERVRFKYMLEGQERDWHEAVSDRSVQYTNLRPKYYRFRVIACNNSGVWNETGDTLEFSIAPAWNQTSWFYASCVATFLALLWGLYRLRLYQIAREFNAQLDGRVDERLRVARELHDTMLQTFQAALIQMQAAYNIFVRRPEKTGESLEKAINTAAGAIAEGRSAIQDLRLHAAGGGDLVQLITTAGQELARSEEASGNPPVLGVTVEGARRDVAPLIQDEVYRIARELLRNAFHHAQAGRIEVEIRYDSRQFRLHVRDDGKGIDSEVLKAGGRAGHYGLPGMRERANRFGGKLDFWSEAGAGTEAVLTVPAAVAYGGSNGGRFGFLRRKLWIHER